MPLCPCTALGAGSVSGSAALLRLRGACCISRAEQLAEILSAAGSLKIDQLKFGKNMRVEPWLPQVSPRLLSAQTDAAQSRKLCLAAKQSLYVRLCACHPLSSSVHAV